MGLTPPTQLPEGGPRLTIHRNATTTPQERVEREPAANSPDDLLWDLRQGDADDNRTSPYGRGWRGVLLSTVLEFNFLTATLAFFTLVIVPVLLVGLAPPFVQAYSRGGLDAAAAISSHRIATLISIAVFVGLALRIGKPLALVALDNFWHLHYTLVFPLFVGLRETITVIIERLAGETRASDDLDRRRRLGALIAASLLAGASLLLARSEERRVGK